MLSFLRFIMLIIVVILLCGCGINKFAYGLQHGNDPAADPNTLSGMTIVNTVTGKKIPTVIDFDYHQDTDTYAYVRNIDGKFVSGTIKYSEAYITNGSGELKYDKANTKWVYVLNGETYDIYQQQYKDIPITGSDKE